MLRHEHRIRHLAQCVVGARDMSAAFEELDYRPTPIGALSLRRRRDLTLGIEILEIKLGEGFLMSSMFTTSEIALADLGLAELSGDSLDVVIGGGGPRLHCTGRTPELGR